MTLVDDSTPPTITLPPGGGNFTLQVSGGNRVLMQGGTTLFSVPNTTTDY